MNTEEKIVAKALKMFNYKGIEYVGMRELAAELDIRVSNITYYFPTKDDLVDRISQDLNRLNSYIVMADESLTLKIFLHRFKLVFSNHLKYRCLLLSFVHLMKQNKKIAARYKKTQKNRHSALKSNITTLIKSGYLKNMSEGDISLTVSAIALIVRFWISEAAVSQRNSKPENQINHYISMIAWILGPYMKPKGKKELRELGILKTGAVLNILSK
jgi:AcrR family transcriptional regulator